MFSTPITCVRPALRIVSRSVIVSFPSLKVHVENAYRLQIRRPRLGIICVCRRRGLQVVLVVQNEAHRLGPGGGIA